MIHIWLYINRRRISLVSVLFAASLVLPVMHGGVQAQSSHARAVTFPCRELLARPTDRSVTISACADSEVELYYEYGTTPSVYSQQTVPERHSAGTPFISVLDGLAPGTRYYYRMRHRLPGAPDYENGTEHSFYTQRRKGATYSFAIEADPHLDGNTSPDLYRKTLGNILAGDNDFLIDLGDTFMSEKLTQQTSDSIRLRHLLLRTFFDLTCHSVPLYLALGNHEGEQGWRLNGTPNSLPVEASMHRTAMYPNPVPDGFYSGNPAPEVFVGLRQNYFSWEWGDALFVVLDPYWYTQAKPGKNIDNWAWTLGRAQYDWFADVLRNTGARYKFVFAHQLIGGSSEGRGGSEFVDFYEMGGMNSDSTWGFTSHRAGWEMPIHQLMVKYDVQAYFHGHDHFYARQEKDGIVYQLVPQPGNPNFRTAGQAAEYGYVTGDILPCAGYLRVTVGDTAATVDYIRSYLPSDENASRHNGDISFSYTLTPRGTTSVAANESAGFPTAVTLATNYPNPFRQVTTFRYFLPEAGMARLTVQDPLGRIVGLVSELDQSSGWHEAAWNSALSLHGTLQPGLYFAVLETGAARVTGKLLLME